MRSDYKVAVRDWVEHATGCQQMTKSGFDSIDIEEMLNIDLTDQASIEESFAIFEELIRQHTDERLVVRLYFSLDYTERFEQCTFTELLSGSLKLRQPPEFYLIKLDNLTETYPEEEYKKKFSQNRVQAQRGEVHAYYHTTKSEGTFSREFVFSYNL